MATYITETGLRVTLSGSGRGGGEGRVFDIAGLPRKVAKIYHAGKVDDELADKLRVMLAFPPRDPMRAGNQISIAWPEALLFVPGSGFAGYLMPRVSHSGGLFEFYNPQMRSRKHTAVTRRDLHRVGRNLCAALAGIHAGPYVVGDMNEGNVLVNPQAMVALVDTDSFQVRDPVTRRVFRCRVGKGEFTPPELQGADLRRVDRHPFHDLFGLGVLLFLLLMEGSHPFMGISRTALSVSSGLPVHFQNIVDGNFPYDPDSDYVPPPAAPPFEVLHPELQRLFMRCFVTGHDFPERRPTAREWHAALGHAGPLLVSCPINPQHVYSSHLAHCPWCRRGVIARGPLNSR